MKKKLFLFLLLLVSFCNSGLSLAEEPIDKNNSNKSLPIILTLKANTTRVVCGQQVAFVLTLLYQKGYGDKFYLQQFIDSGFDILDMQDLPADEVTYKTKNYKRLRKKIIAQVTKNESFMAAPINVTWMLSSEQNMGGFNTYRVLSELFSSNSLSFIVDPLPQGISLVASNVQVTSYVSPEVCKVGQGMTYVVEVMADTNLKNYSMDSLLIDKELFDCYFSTAHQLPDNGTGLFTKKFEFIIQPKHSGNYDLPMQTIHYFDPKNKKIRQTSTEPLLINIVPDPMTLNSISLTENKSSLQKSLPTFENKSFFLVEQLYIDWKVYWSLIFCVIIVMTTFSLIILFNNSFNGKKRKLLNELTFLINKAQKEGDYKKLYALLEILIHNRDILGILNESDQKALKSFFDSLCVIIFSEKYAVSYEHLFIQANQWIAYIVKKIPFF